LANAEAITTAKNIVLSDPSRTFVVVSAPGKCKEFPRKVTDLLIEAYTEMRICSVQGSMEYVQSESLEKVFGRFRELAKQLGVDIEAEMERTYEDIIINQNNYDFVISRGEYLMALLFARLLDYKFIDAANYIVIKKNGKYHETATAAKFNRCVAKNERIVMGGFYGATVDSGIKAFTRGGSDYSGAIAAVSLKAEVYENFTDTYGVQTANPVIIKDTKSIAELDYKTMHKLSVAGASVIYPDCLPLLSKYAMPLKVDNTFDPGRCFTRIDTKKVTSKYFCITYKFEQNINKDTVEILCAFNKISISMPDLRKVLKDIEVYLVHFDKKSFALIAPSTNLDTVVNLLHGYFLGK